MTWDETFMTMVYTASGRSHDTRTKIGAVAVAPDNTPKAMGYNALPRGIVKRNELI